MKKITIMSIMLMTAVLAVGLSGCLGSADNNHPVKVNSSAIPSGNVWMERDEADIRSVDILIKDDEVIARITTELGRDESLDLRGIKVRQFRNTVSVSVPSVEPTHTQGNQIVDVKLGSVRSFSTGKEYTIVVNGEHEKRENMFFKIDDGTLMTVKPASVHSIKIEENEGKVIAVAEISVPDKTACIVDGKNITLRHVYDKEFDVYVPITVQGEPQANAEDFIYHEIIIGNLSQLPNGRYEIDLNNRETSFIIQNGQLIPVYIQTGYYD